MPKKESSLEKLKKDYLKMQKKHNLPEFDKLNRDFQIEKASEVETDFLIREIRKLIAEKVYNYFRFIETLLNPVNAPMSIFSVIKTLRNEDKEKLKEIYKEMARMEINLLETDIDFAEEKEAKFINDSYEAWQGMKKTILEVVRTIKDNWDNKSEEKRRGYFG